MATRKFYRAENAKRPFPAGVLFEIYDIVAGSANGVFATDDQAQIEALDKEVADPGKATESISEFEYEGYLKKKAPLHSAFLNLNVPPRLSQQPSPLKGQGVAVVTNEPAAAVPEPEAPVEIPKSLEKVDDALAAQPVTIPKDASEAKAQVSKNKVLGKRETQ